MFDFNIQNTASDTAVATSSNKTLAHAFIERLSHDDAFRAYTVADPVAAAAQYGFAIDRSKLPEGGITLPPKDVMIAYQAQIAEKFSVSAHTIIVFHI